MKLNVLIILGSLSALSSACAMVDQYSQASKYDANSPEAQECGYEAKKATASMPNTSRSGINFEQMFKEKELFNLCMQGKQGAK
jgi:hypothetical protein